MTTLQCPYCPSIRFLQVVQLVLPKDGGQTPRPDGLVCAQCHAEVDPTHARDVMNLAEKKKQLQAMQAEVDEGQRSGVQRLSGSRPGKEAGDKRPAGG